MKRKALAAIGVFFIALTVYFVFVVDDENNLSNENEVQNINELVNDFSVGNIEDQSASITSHQLIVTNNDNSQSTYDLPEDEFFVSIAPYISQTHP